MRFRLLRRRLTISSPRMAVRSALPWPFRWAMLALVMGFCSAIGLWAFELGKEIAGLERGSKEEAQRLRGELITVQGELLTTRQALDKAQSIANTADARVATERASHEGLLAQVKQLEQENRSLRDDLGFFERLIPANGVTGITIRGLQVEKLDGGRLKWQALIIQSGKNPAEFNGRLELSFSGTQDGKPWNAVLPGEAPAVRLRQLGRVSGEFLPPQQVHVTAVTAKVLDGTVVKATQLIKL